MSLQHCVFVVCTALCMVTCAPSPGLVTATLPTVDTMSSASTSSPGSNTVSKAPNQGRRQAQPVTLPAFTAYLSHYYSQLGQQDIVVFDKTLTNDGGYYDVTSGKFTAPYAGLYIFSFIIETKHNVDTAVRLVVDGANQLDAVAEPRHTEQNVQGGNVGILRLNKGQQVWVEIYNTNGQSLEGTDTYRFTTFTGALLAEVEENVIG